MANRPFFVVSLDETIFKVEETEFEFFTGFAISQKHKSIRSFHDAIKKKYPESNLLEVSRKSENPLGAKLSAFNLKLYNKSLGRNLPVESIFQSSKVFENGNQYEDLLIAAPIDAKRDERLRNSGAIIAFRYDGIGYPNIPRTLFYDWIYINALWQNKELLQELSQYDIFTDIEFNPKKSLNCQAKACAIAVSLYKQGKLEEYLSDIEIFKTVYPDDSPMQTSLF